MRYYCPTNYAILLMAVPDKKNILRFPVSSLDEKTIDFPGIQIAVRPQTTIFEQLKTEADLALGRDILAKEAHFFKSFSVPLYTETKEDSKPFATLYLGKMLQAESGEDIGITWSELMRKVPKNMGKSRLSYLKGMQALAGMLEQDYKAVEFKDPTEIKET